MDECLQSVLDQTYQDWECIIVNDGSPDNTEEIALQWTAKDVRFKYLIKENGGLSSARNAGIEIAIGQWILPLDCDDKIGELYLELAEKEFDNGYTIIYCEAKKFGNSDELWDLPSFSLENIAFSNIIFCTAFFKKAEWQNVGGYDTCLIYGLEDWDFWISILKENNKTVYKIPSICFYYRIKDESMITELENDKKKKMTRIISDKHKVFFYDYLGDFPTLAQQIKFLKRERDLLIKIRKSKRYIIVDKIAKFYDYFF